MSHEPQRVYILVLKIWRESTDDDTPPEWRGQVKDPLSGDTHYFRTLKNLQSTVESFILPP